MTTNITYLSKKLSTFFTDTATKIGQESGYSAREAQKWPADLFFRTLVGTYLREPDASLAAHLAVAALEDVDASRQGLDKRFNQRSARFMEGMLKEGIKITVSISEPLGISLLDRFDAVFISDGSVINLPVELANIYKGSGNDPSQKNFATVKLHIALDLSSGRLWGPTLGSGRAHDQSGAISPNILLAGSVVIRDLGFFNLEEMKKLDQNAVYTLSRLKMGTVVYNLAGQRLDLIKTLEGQQKPRVELSVLLGREEKMRCRLLATKIPSDLIKKGKGTAGDSENEDKWAGWRILVTNIPGQKLSLEEGFALYRARWQIELLWKRWKQQGLIDEWRTKKPSRILCELYAKLIAMLIGHWLCVLGCWEDASRSMVMALEMVQMMAICLMLFIKDEKIFLLVMKRLQQAIWIVSRMGKSRKKPSTAAILRDPALGLFAETKKELPIKQIQSIFISSSNLSERMFG